MFSNHVRVSMFAMLLPRFFHRQNSRMGITTLQLNSRCMSHVGSVFTTTFQQHAHHHLRTVAQLAPQATTFSFTLHNEKQRASVDSRIFNMLFGSTQAPSWGFSGFPVFSAVFRVFLFETVFRQHVQKGHNYHACHRFLKKAPNAATCVCPTLDQGSYPTTFPQAGDEGPSKRIYFMSWNCGWGAFALRHTITCSGQFRYCL